MFKGAGELLIIGNCHHTADCGMRFAQFETDTHKVCWLL